MCDLKIRTGCDQAWTKSERPEPVEECRHCLLSDHVTESPSVSGKGAASSEALFICSQTMFVSSSQSSGNSGGIPRLYSFKVLNVPYPYRADLGSRVWTGDSASLHPLGH